MYATLTTKNGVVISRYIGMLIIILDKKEIEFASKMLMMMPLIPTKLLLQVWNHPLQLSLVGLWMLFGLFFKILQSTP